MILNYIHTNNIDLSVVNNFTEGDSVVCIDPCMNITSGNKYEVLFVYVDNKGNKIAQISDDDNEISGYNITRFLSLGMWYDIKLKNIISKIK